MAAMCPSCRYDIDPFVAHWCGVPDWSPRLSKTPDVMDPRTLAVHPDSRGNVRETYRASWYPTVPPVKQLVRSASRPNTLRGMHRHLKQWDIWHFVEGSALVRLYNHETGANTFHRLDAGSTLAIPPTISHGFYSEAGCVLLYALTEEYDGTDEYGWFPMDGLYEDSHPGWPRSFDGLIISERDIRATRLADFMDVA